MLSAIYLISVLVTVASSSLATRRCNYRLLAAHLFVFFFNFVLIGPNEPVQNISGPHWSGLRSHDGTGWLLRLNCGVVPVGNIPFLD